jgi:hypothetical protein
MYVEFVEQVIAATRPLLKTRKASEYEVRRTDNQ